MNEKTIIQRQVTEFLNKPIAPRGRTDGVRNYRGVFYLLPQSYQRMTARRLKNIYQSLRTIAATMRDPSITSWKFQDLTFNTNLQSLYSRYDSLDVTKKSAIDLFCMELHQYQRECENRPFFEADLWPTLLALEQGDTPTAAMQITIEIASNNSASLFYRLQEGEIAGVYSGVFLRDCEQFLEGLHKELIKHTNTERFVEKQRSSLSYLDMRNIEREAARKGDNPPNFFLA